MAKEKVQEQNAPQEALYSIAELVAARKRFGYTGALIEAALRESGEALFTLTRAQEIISAFAKRPIRRD